MKSLKSLGNKSDIVPFPMLLSMLLCILTRQSSYENQFLSTPYIAFFDACSLKLYVRHEEKGHGKSLFDPIRVMEKS